MHMYEVHAHTHVEVHTRTHAQGTQPHTRVEHACPWVRAHLPEVQGTMGGGLLGVLGRGLLGTLEGTYWGHWEGLPGASPQVQPCQAGPAPCTVPTPCASRTRRDWLRGRGGGAGWAEPLGDRYKNVGGSGPGRDTGVYWR